MILDSTVRVVPPTADGDYLVWASPGGYQAAAFVPSAPAEPRVEVDEVTDALGRPVKDVRLYDGGDAAGAGAVAGGGHGL